MSGAFPFPATLLRERHDVTLRMSGGHQRHDVTKYRTQVQGQVRGTWYNIT